MMAITITDAHRRNVIEQVNTMIINLQNAVHRNALRHKIDAQNKTMTLPDLQARILDVLANYDAKRAKLRHFRDVTIVNDTQFLVVGEGMGLTIQTLGVVGQQLADELDLFAAMPRTTYAEIIAACDYLITNVNPPLSL